MKPKRAVLVAILLASPIAITEAQTLREPAPLTDALLSAHLATQADTAALLSSMLPAALDSLRHSSDTLGLGTLVAAYPQLALSAELGSGLDSAWLASLVDTGLLRGICQPVRIACRSRTAIAVRLEDQPGIGDNAIRLGLRLTSVTTHHGRRSVAPYRDDNARLLRLWELGVYQPGPARISAHIQALVPEPYLLVERTLSAWRIVGWFE